MVIKPNLREYAVIGAKVRLVELDKEREAIHRAFPELNGAPVNGHPSKGKAKEPEIIFKAEGKTKKKKLSELCEPPMGLKRKVVRGSLPHQIYDYMLSLPAGTVLDGGMLASALGAKRQDARQAMATLANNKLLKRGNAAGKYVIPEKPE